MRELARDFAAADGAAAYGRTGSCLGRFGTLVAFLLDALNAVTGNLDRPGGAVFGRAPVPLDKIGEQVGLDTYGKLRSRVGGFPDVIGNMPASLLAREIETPGEGQIRALFVSAGNPVLSVPDGGALERALGQLELCVSLDLYVNETNRHADYVLPTTTFYEREDLPIALMGFFTTPFVQYTEAVVEPPGECRQEWEIVDDLSRRIGVAPYSAQAAAAAGQARLPDHAEAAGRRAAAHRPARRPVRPAPRRPEPQPAARAAARDRARRARGDRRAPGEAAHGVRARPARAGRDRSRRRGGSRPRTATIRASRSA